MPAMIETKPRERLLRAMAEAWRPRERLATPDWCAKNVRLPADFGTPGRYDLDDFPFWREPLAACDDPDVYSITFMTGTQVGKTETIKAALAAQSDVDPAPMMLIGPDKDYISEQKDKIYAAAEINPVLHSRLPPVSRRNLRWVDFGRCYCYLAWTGNTQRVSGKAVKFIVCSEVDRYKQPIREGAITKLIKERVKSFIRYKIIYESTPQDENSNIGACYNASDRRKYHVPCPHCGHYQELRFFPHKDGPYEGKGGVSGLKDENGDWISIDQVTKTAFYLCENGCRIESADKPAMVSRGVWCPEGQRVNVDGQLEGTPAQSGAHRGYQFGSICARTISFGRIAAEYLDSRESSAKLQNFFNNWLGLPFSKRAKVPKWSQLGRRLAGGHPRGKVPAAAAFALAGVDVQSDRCYYIVRAYGEGKTSWQIESGVCVQLMGGDGTLIYNSDLDQLIPLLINRKFPLVQPNAVGVSQMPVLLVGVDTGFEPSRVHEWARKFTGERVRCVSGNSQMHEPFYRMSLVEKNARTGKPYPGGMKQWQINVNTYKADIQNRWQQPTNEAGAWFVHDKAVETAETYLRQVTNEGKLPKTNKETGRTEYVWQVIDEQLGNHYWDCEVYANALADMVTGGVWENVLQRAAPAPAARSAVINPGSGRPDGRAW